MSLHVPIQRYVEDPKHTMPSTHLTSEVYAAAISAFVIVCTDAIIIHRVRRTVFLAKRRMKPMQGLWIIGGRMKAGESWEAAIHRKFKQETSLDIAEKRFNFLRVNQYLWKDRQQEPQDVGSDNIALTFTVELEPSEIEAASHALDATEYDTDFGLSEFDRERLVSSHVHPAILDMYDQTFG